MEASLTDHDPEIRIPTIWGLDPVQLHDRFWAARGVQVVRQGQRSQIVHHAELFLLTDPRSLALFKIGPLVDPLSWLKPELMSIRLRSTREHGYREEVLFDVHGRFERFCRIYGASDSRITRMALTPSRQVAERWQNAPSPREGWRQLRRTIGRTRRTAVTVEGGVYDRTAPRELHQLVRDLTQIWKTPDATIHRARPVGSGVWADVAIQLSANGKLIGPAWIGAGRTPPAGMLVGPAVLWDDPARRPAVNDIEWLDIEPSGVPERPVNPARTSSVSRGLKGAFDVVFASVALLLTLPIYPLIMLAIWIEDGRPFFFIHRRETLGGREFPCIKFRTMRNDADRIKAKLMARNRADGPQFFIDPDEDPRLTVTGKLLRKLNLDELPQFFNVLVGHMSVVGPRPSPRMENQCCPAWREARLSVRPGITGLWQVMRTRQEGMDFQEWIKYDIRYVERQSWAMDLFIIWRTLLILLKL
jgi:lipopolysaccharide/colanic/teichoic acid biosynthesis glycosyltransferase